MLTQLARAVAGAPCVGCGRSDGPLCEACRSALPPPVEGVRLPHVRRVLCPWDYGGSARRLILDLKLRGLSAAAGPLVAGVIDIVHRRGLRADTITWVPCRRSDRRRRGFDHAEVLARGVASGLGVAAVPLLARARDGLDQAGLSATQRADNLRGAFTARRWDGHVALVDDLVTTGATAGSCARAMRLAGVTGVEVLAPCRA